MPRGGSGRRIECPHCAGALWAEWTHEFAITTAESSEVEHIKESINRLERRLEAAAKFSAMTGAGISAESERGASDG